MRRVVASGMVLGLLTAAAGAVGAGAETRQSCLGFEVTIDAAGVPAGEPVVGTQGPDVILGTAGGDRIIGLGGDDVICGAGGDDNIRGGPGDDVIDAGSGDDVARGGPGDDEIHGGSGDDPVINGGTGDDEVYGDAGDDGVIGGPGDDVIEGGPGDDGGLPGQDVVLLGQSGVDVISGGPGADKIRGGAGNDTLEGGDGIDWVYGGGGADEISGGSGDDVIEGNSGPDMVHGGDGSDVIKGADHIDRLFGEEGDDTLLGGRDDDMLDGGPGDDVLLGEGGNDTLVGGTGDDTLNGAPGADVDDGGEGNDACHGQDDVVSTCEYEGGCLPIYSGQEYLVSVDGAWEPGLVVSDLTGDGLEDVLVTRLRFGWPLEFPVDLLVNDGQGGLRVSTSDHLIGAVPLTQMTSPGRAVIADFNGDSVDDVFLPDFGMDDEPFPGYQNTLLLSGSGGMVIDASTNLPQRLDATHSAAAADVDGDGDVDLYVGNIWAQLQVNPYLLLNDGTGRFAEAVGSLPHLTHLTQNGFTSAAFVDVNRDDAPDLVLGTAGDGIDNEDSVPDSVILLNDGSGTFQLLDGALPAGPFVDRPDQIALHIAAGDLNLDGYPDLAIDFTKSYVGRMIQILINNGDGTYRDETKDRLPQTDNDAANLWGLELTDINRDGAPDLMARPFDDTSPIPIIFVNDGTGVFTPGRLEVDLTWLYYEFIDIDADGGRDIVISTFNTTTPEDILVARDLGCSPEQG